MDEGQSRGQLTPFFLFTFQILGHISNSSKGSVGKMQIHCCPYVNVENQTLCFCQTLMKRDKNENTKVSF